MVALRDLTLSSLFPVHGMLQSSQTGKVEIHPMAFTIQVILACLNYQAHSYIDTTVKASLESQWFRDFGLLRAF